MTEAWKRTSLIARGGGARATCNKPHVCGADAIRLVVPYQCIDRRGASFLGVFRMHLVVFGAGRTMALRVAVLPLPQSRYLLTKTDVCAPTHRTFPMLREFALQGMQFRAPIKGPVPPLPEDFNSVSWRPDPEVMARLSSAWGEPVPGTVTAPTPWVQQLE
jgi:hypothetical protein